MDVLWISLLAVPVLLCSSVTFEYYFKMFLYFTAMVCMAVVSIPMCILYSRGRDAENMRVICFLVRHVKYLIGVRFAVSGRENLQVDGPYVLVSNHQCSLDVLGMAEVMPRRCVSVAKKELWITGVVGLMCWLGGNIFINRQRTDDAKSIMSATARNMLKDQIRVWVFPEGTRNHEGALLPFKKGAFHLAVQAQVPVIPAVFSSYNHFYRSKEKVFKSGTVMLRFLPAIETKGLGPDDVSALSDKCHDVMCSAYAEFSNTTTGPSQ